MEKGPPRASQQVQRAEVTSSSMTTLRKGGRCIPCFPKVALGAQDHVKGHLKNRIPGGVRCPSLEVCKWRPWLFGLQRWVGSPKHQEVPQCVPAQGYHLGIASPETSRGGAAAPPPNWALRLQAPGPTSLPGTTTGRTRLGGTETGWRLNRKWEWGFQKGRQEIINLLINSSGAGGREGAVPPQFRGGRRGFPASGLLHIQASHS